MDVEVTASDIARYKRQAYIFIIIAGILFLIGAFIIYSEIHGARSFCKSVHGNASPTGKTCNSEALVKYSDGWNFKRTEIGDIYNITINASQP